MLVAIFIPSLMLRTFRGDEHTFSVMNAIFPLTCVGVTTNVSTCAKAFSYIIFCLSDILVIILSIYLKRLSNEIAVKEVIKE